MHGKTVSEAVIGRLPRYYRYLSDLMNEGVERISSEDLSRRMGVTASQIRQDFNIFGGFGQQGYGYKVSFLRDEIAKILGIDHEHSVAIVGAGHLGSALAGYAKFATKGFIVKVLFDISPDRIGKTVGEVPIYSMEDVKDYLNGNDIDIFALAIPKSEVLDTAAKLYDMGVRAFWNFAHSDLALPDDAIVESVHLSESLMRLSYRVKASRED